MCIQKLHLDIYAKYYNYTLEMAVKSKFKNEKKFRQADLYYVLSSLLSVSQMMNGIIGSQPCNWFKINRIFISPEGTIKIYPFPLEF